jgi:hypothetical protein
MKKPASRLISTLIACLGILGAIGSAQADVLLDLVNPAVQNDTAYSLSFTATNPSTTLSVAGYQVPSYEQATENGLLLNDAGSNLLGQIWNFVPAGSGSLADQYSDGSSVNALDFGGVSVGSYDTFSQTIATTVGSSYTYNFLFTEDDSGPSGFMVSANATVGNGNSVPEPLSVALFGIGLAALGARRRKIGQR